MFDKRVDDSKSSSDRYLSEGSYQGDLKDKSADLDCQHAKHSSFCLFMDCSCLELMRIHVDWI